MTMTLCDNNLLDFGKIIFVVLQSIYQRKYTFYFDLQFYFVEVFLWF